MEAPSLMKQMYQTDDSVALKDSVNKVIDKFLIIGMNLINQKNFKKTAQKQIYDLEQQAKKFVEMEHFKKETTSLE
jgi:hypothetical protein